MAKRTSKPDVDSALLETIVEQNPWQSERSIPPALAPAIERPLARALWSRLETDQPHRFQIILGPRRVGKTTTMYQTVRTLLKGGIGPSRLWWLRLDHPMLMRRDLGHIVRTVQVLGAASAAEPLYLFMDELTYAKDWDLWLKTFYDEHFPVRIVGSSSSTAALRDRRLESGVGRWDEQFLAPYLLDEYLELVGLSVGVPHGETLRETVESAITLKLPAEVASHRRRLLLTGGFPELLLALRGQADDASRVLESQRTLRSDAVERAIYKDIPQAYGVDRPMLLERALYVLADQATGLLSPTSICKDLDSISVPTLEKYISYLERAFIVFTLPNYSGSERNTQKRYRKLYFVDGAVRNAALQRGLRPLSDNLEMSLLLENAAAAHIHSYAQQDQLRLYHWRDGDHEVDLLLDDPRAPVAFEIASSPRHHRRGLHALAARHPRYKGACYVVAPDAGAIRASDSTDGVGTLPLDLLLLCAGAQARRALQRRLAG